METVNDIMDATQGSSLLDSAVSILMKMGTVVVGLVAIIGGVLYVKQDSLLYFPEIGGIPKQSSRNPRGYRSPEERQIPYESHMIPCEDGVKIHAWLLLHNYSSKNPQTKSPTIIFFHGNAGNIGLRLPNAMKMLQLLGANILMVEYRGYGDSDTVAPSEKGLQKDAQAALQFCQNHPYIDPYQVILFGRSLGGAVAFYLADYAQRHQLPLAAVVVENTFLSVPHMVDQLMPFLTPMKAVVLRIGWNSYRLVPTLHTPTLYLAGLQDELVPHFHMQQLYQLQKNGSSSNNPHVELYVVPEGTHNETWLRGGVAYWEAIQRFLQQVLATTTSCTPPPPGMAPPLSSSTTATSPAVASSIPTMSKRLVDMAMGKAAATTTTTPDKKLD